MIVRAFHMLTFIAFTDLITAFGRNYNCNRATNMTGLDVLDGLIAAPGMMGLTHSFSISFVFDL
jgi:hypothetical protein